MSKVVVIPDWLYNTIEVHFINDVNEAQRKLDYFTTKGYSDKISYWDGVLRARKVTLDTFQAKTLEA